MSVAQMAAIAKPAAMIKGTATDARSIYFRMTEVAALLASLIKARNTAEPFVRWKRLTIWQLLAFARRLRGSQPCWTRPVRAGRHFHHVYWPCQLLRTRLQCP